jgi:hypothetical protein
MMNFNGGFLWVVICGGDGGLIFCVDGVVCGGGLIFCVVFGEIYLHVVDYIIMVDDSRIDVYYILLGLILA